MRPYLPQNSTARIKRAMQCFDAFEYGSQEQVYSWQCHQHLSYTSNNAHITIEITLFCWAVVNVTRPFTPVIHLINSEIFFFVYIKPVDGHKVSHQSIKYLHITATPLHHCCVPLQGIDRKEKGKKINCQSFTQGQNDSMLEEGPTVPIPDLLVGTYMSILMCPFIVISQTLE